MSHVNLFELDFSQLKIAKSGRNIKIIYNKEPVQIVTGKMYTPFGVKANQNNFSQFATYHLDCSLNQSTSDISVKYRESLEKLDNRIIELIQDNLQLFNTNVSREDIPSVYSRILRENKTYPKLMKISLPRDSKGNFESVIFDENKNKILLEESTIENVLCKGKIFKTIIECGKLWYYNGRFGTTWTLKQLKFAEAQNLENEKQKNINNNNDIYQTIMICDD
jgi:hypothetical protein